MFSSDDKLRSDGHQSIGRRNLEILRQLDNFRSVEHLPRYAAHTSYQATANHVEIDALCQDVDDEKNAEQCNQRRHGFSGERLKCGTAETGRPERSELAALSAVATTDLFAVDFIGENAVVPVLCKDKLELFHGGNWSG